MAGRFTILTDEHWSNAHVNGAREAGWEVIRVVDALGQSIEDPEVLAYCGAHGHVWLTRDERAKGHVTQWLSAGKRLPGVIIIPQRHQLAPGGLVQFLQSLASEEMPFAGVIRFLAREEE